MQAGGQVGGLTERQLFQPGTSPHLTHDDQAGMDAQAHRQAHPPFLHQASIQRAHGLHDGQARPHRPLGIVFMGLRIAKVDQQPIAEILCDVSFKAIDDRSTGLLIGPHNLAQLFGVELL